jgi:sterol desaturase/sphingolipid hydroxylase (fatty acid hydroxylase superfamily)
MNAWSPIIVNLLRYILIAGTAFFIFYKWFPSYFSKNKIQPKLVKTKDFIREILHSAQTTVVIAVVSVLIFTTPLATYTQVYYNLSDKPLWWIPLSVVIMLIIHDTYFYWMHRTVHHPKLFKHIHLVHHKSTNPTPFASYSFHIFESILEGLIAPILLFTLPLHPLSLVIFSTISFLFNVYGHLGYEIMPKWFRKSFLFEILNTSTHHNIHHSKFKGNYGLYFRFWDRIMNTEHPNYVKNYDNIQKRRFGISKGPFTHNRSIRNVFLILVVAFITVSATYPYKDGIEGKWKIRDNGAIVLIYEDKGLYFGKLIEARNEKDNQKIKDKGEIIIIRGFKEESQNTYCCGTVYAPKRNKILQATMTLENSNKLKIDARYGIFSDSRILDKLK